MERFKIQSPIRDLGGKMATVCRLLTTESDCLQRYVIKFEKSAGSKWSGNSQQLVMGSPCRCERYLLFEDDVKESRESRLASPHWRRAECLYNAAEIRITPRQKTSSPGKGFVVEAGRKLMNFSHFLGAQASCLHVFGRASWERRHPACMSSAGCFLIGFSRCGSRLQKQKALRVQARFDGSHKLE